MTQLLISYRDGDREAFEQIVPLVYGDMLRIARRQLGRNDRGQTLDTQGLVHEAYLKLIDQTRANWQDRNHFLAISACAMRQVIISHARRRKAVKRGGGARVETLDENLIGADAQADWLLAVDGALERLQERHERLAKVVECRFFAGYSEQETADALGISLRTAQRDWMRARAWLQEDLRSQDQEGEL